MRIYVKKNQDPILILVTNIINLYHGTRYYDEDGEELKTPEYNFLVKTDGDITYTPDLNVFSVLIDQRLYRENFNCDEILARFKKLNKWNFKPKDYYCAGRHTLDVNERKSIESITVINAGRKNITTEIETSRDTSICIMFKVISYIFKYEPNTYYGGVVHNNVGTKLYLVPE